MVRAHAKIRARPITGANDKGNDNALHNGDSDISYPFPDRLPFL
jgi:hypothetical protein